MTHRSIVLGAALAALLAGAANAEDRSEGVSYRDLDLTSLEGQAVLQQRLDSAVLRVCRFNIDGYLASPAEKDSCYRQARKEVDAQVAQLITKTHRSR